ncbi:hypothetical protein, partial [Salmonella sp. s51228]|uniref:hypothetical protein n=1 Tax=Salmonella sp. s51228 TaxID=3159652 RepID=UPI0039810F80
MESDPIDKASDNPNFPSPSLSMDCLLPREQLYLPPLEVQILDKRPFGRKPIIGVYTIRSLKPFIVHTPGSKEAQELLINDLSILTVKKSQSETSKADSNEIKLPLLTPVKQASPTSTEA